MKRSILAAALPALIVLSALPGCRPGKEASRGSGSSPKITIIDDEARLKAEKERLEAANVDYGSVLGEILPAAGSLLGWKPEGEPVTADAASFASVASGVDRAGEILHYGLTAYRRASYRDGAGEGSRLAVEILRMDKLLGAFGVYAGYRDPSYEYRHKGLGNQAFVHDGTLYLWNSHFVVRAHLEGASSAEGGPEGILEAAGKEIAARLRPKEPPILPRYLRVFPGSEIVTNTQKYSTEPFLGLSFLGPALTAEYARQEGLLQAFLLIYDDDGSAADAFHRLIEHWKELGAVRQEYLGVGAESVSADVPGHQGGAFFLQQRFIGGFLGIEGDALPTDILQGFVDRIDGLFWKQPPEGAEPGAEGEKPGDGGR